MRQRYTLQLTLTDSEPVASHTAKVELLRVVGCFKACVWSEVYKMQAEKLSPNLAMHTPGHTLVQDYSRRIRRVSVLHAEGLV